MTVIGSAYVMIRAITDKLESDIEKSLGPSVNKVGEKAGKDLANSINKGFSGTKIADGGSSFKDVENQAKKSVDKINKSKIKLNKVDTTSVRREMKDVESVVGRSGKNAGGNFITNFGKSNISAIMKRMFYQILFGIPAVGALAGALSSLVSGLFSVASAIGPAANALAILPGLFFSAAAAAGTLFAAFAGLGKALSAGNKAISGVGGGGGSKSSEKSANRIADAHQDAAEKIAGAYEKARERTEAANKAMAKAQEKLQDVVYENAKNILSAQRSLRSAEEGLTDAQRKSISVQDAVNRARAAAIDRIIELQFAVEGAAISEGKAVIALERAQEKLAQVSELPVDHRLRREAELNYRQAVLDLEEAKKANEDLAKEQASSNAAGIEGSKEVLDAKQEQIDAAHDLRDAEEEVADARAELSETEKKNARDLRDAKEDILDIEKEFVEIQKDLKKELAEANKDLARTLRDVGLSAGAGGAAGGVDQFAEAMKNLSPEAQRFVKYLLSIKDQFKILRSEAGKELFPKLETAIQGMLNSGFINILSTGMRKIGSAIGDVAVQFSNLISSPFFQGNFTSLMDSSVVVTKELGSAFVNLVSLFTSLATAARPFTEEFSRWINTITGSWAEKASGDVGGLQEKIGEGVQVTKQLGRIFSSLWQSIKNVADAARPAGQTLLDSFEKALVKLEELTGDNANKENMKKYFLDVAENVRTLGTLFNSVALAFVKLGNNPAISKIADTLNSEVVPAIESLLEKSTESVGPAMAEALAEVVGVFEDLASGGGLEAFVDTIKGLASAINMIIDLPGIKQIFPMVAAGFGTWKALNLVSSALGIREIGKSFTFIKETVTGAIDGIKKFSAANAAGTGPLNSFKNGLSTFGSTAKEAATSAMTGLKSGVSSAGSFLKDAGKRAAEGFKNGLSTLGGIAKSAAQSAANGVKSGLSALRSGASNAASAASGALKKGLSSIGSAASTAAGKLKALTASLKASTTASLKSAAASAKDALAKAAATTKTYALAAAEKIAAGAKKIGAIAQRVLNTAMRANPIGIIITAILALVAAFVYLWKNNESFRKFFIGMWEGIKKVVASVAGWFKDTLVPFFQKIWSGISKSLQSLSDFFKKIWSAIVTIVTTYINVYRTIVKTVFETVRNIVVGIWNGIKNAASTVWNAIVLVVKTYIEVYRTIITTVFNVVKNTITTIWNAIKTVISTAWQWIVNAVTIYINAVRTVVSSVFSAISSFVTSVWNGIKNTVTAVWSGILSTTSSIINTILSIVRNVFTNIKNTVSSIMSGIAAAVSGVWRNVLNTVSGVINNTRNTIVGGFTRIRDGVIGLFSGMASKIGGAFASIAGVVKGPINGVINLVNKAIDGLNRIKVDVPSWVPGVGGKKWGIDIKRIPALADGGTVAASNGGTLALIAEAGRDERVTPLRSDGLSEGESRLLTAIEGQERANIVINVYANETQNVTELANEISRRLAFKM